MTMFEQYWSELMERFSTPFGTVVQIIGFAGMLFSFLTYLPRRRKVILGVRITSNALWVLNYLFLGISGSVAAFSGVVTNGVETVRGVVFGHKPGIREKCGRRAFLVPLAFVFTSAIAITVITVLLTKDDPGAMGRELAVASMAMAATAFSTFAMWRDDPLQIRLWMLPCILLWLAQSVIIRNPASLLSSAGELVADVIGIVRELALRRRSRSAQ